MTILNHVSGKGLFIVLEGIDGSGKTTLATSMKSILESEGYAVMITAEPTDGPIGRLLRSEQVDSPRAEALLFVADRACHTESMMASVEKGVVVICDRYYGSTLAYQSASSTEPVFDIGFLEMLNDRVISEPDITFVLDIDPEESLRRVDVRGEQKSKFERLEFQKRVRENYLRISEERGFHVLDASGSPEEVCSMAMKQIHDKMR